MNDESIISGEIINNTWFLKAINGDLDYLKKNALINVGNTGESNCTALMYAANGGHLDCVKFLVNFKKELEKKDINGNTALIYATKAGHSDIVKLLVPFEGGIINNNGQSALDFAIENKDEKCIKILQNTSIDNIKYNDDLIKENKQLKDKLDKISKVIKEIDNKIEKDKILQ